MALLRIPDKYAIERGGWKTDHVMKKVYTHTFSQGRQGADDMMDDFFNKIITPQPQLADQKKYQAWLTLFDKNASEESLREFKKFMQHENHKPL